MHIKPFRSFMPAGPAKTTLPGPPYDTIDRAEASAMAATNEHSILHINRPEIDVSADVDIYADEVYAKGRQNLESFIEKGWLVKDDAEAFYVYQVRKGDVAQTGFVALTPTQAYVDGKIKRHEFTTLKKEEDRVRHIKTQKANVGYVYLAYRDTDSLDTILKKITATEPALVVDANCDGATHTVWRVTSADMIAEIQKAFEEDVPALYICDGHHRASAGTRVGTATVEERLAAGAKPEEVENYRYFMSVIFPESKVQVFDYNRILTKFDMSTVDLLSNLEEAFEVTEIAKPEGYETDKVTWDEKKHFTPPHYAKPTKNGEFAMYRDGQWYKLTLRTPVEHEDPVELIDSQILTRKVLEPLCDITVAKLRDCPIMKFVGGTRGLQEMERVIDQHKDTGAIGFALFPCSMGQVMSVADAGKTMPPKSTWVTKVLSGTNVYCYED